MIYKQFVPQDKARWQPVIAELQSLDTTEAEDKNREVLWLCKDVDWKLLLSRFTHAHN